MNSSMPMNCVAGTSPSAFGSHGDVPACWQPAIGSGKTRPSVEYAASLVATGDASALGAATRHAAAASAARTALLNPETPTSRPLRRSGLLQRTPRSALLGYNTGMRFTPDRPLGVAPASASDYRELARRRLPRQLFDYIDGGAYEEATMRANVA